MAYQSVSKHVIRGLTTEKHTIQPKLKGPLKPPPHWVDAAFLLLVPGQNVSLLYLKGSTADFQPYLCLSEIGV